MKPVITALLLLLISSASTNSSAYEQPDVDIEIVLAVDASGSVDRSELTLQLNGISAAFRDPDILNAIGKGELQKIMISVLIWSDAAYNKVPTDWFLINSPESAEIFAKKVETFSVRHGAITSIGGGGTGLGSALAYALAMIKNNKIKAVRQIVDISGDGRESTPWNKGAIMLPQARAIAKSLNVTVNGLAIETDIPNLTAYYRDYVLVGPGSFALRATSFIDYKRAIKKKLLRELSPVVVGQLRAKK